MRPKKRIAIWSADSDKAGVLRFLLQTHSYATIDLSPKKPRGFQVDGVIVICDGTQLQAEGAAKRADAAAPGKVLAVLYDRVQPPMGAAMSIPGNASSMELLERVAMISARKRGPRPRSKHAIVPIISDFSTGFIHRAPGTVQKRR